LIAHSVATYAASFKGFPKRSIEAVAATKKTQHKYHGHKLVM
jgi:aminopeptidase Y